MWSRHRPETVKNKKVIMANLSTVHFINNAGFNKSAVEELDKYVCSSIMLLNYSTGGISLKSIF